MQAKRSTASRVNKEPMTMLNALRTRCRPNFPYGSSLQHAWNTSFPSTSFQRAVLFKAQNLVFDCQHTVLAVKSQILKEVFLLWPCLHSIIFYCSCSVAASTSGLLSSTFWPSAENPLSLMPTRTRASGFGHVSKTLGYFELLQLGAPNIT